MINKYDYLRKSEENILGYSLFIIDKNEENVIEELLLLAILCILSE